MLEKQFVFLDTDYDSEDSCGAVLPFYPRYQSFLFEIDTEDTDFYGNNMMLAVSPEGKILAESIASVVNTARDDIRLAGTTVATFRNKLTNGQCFRFVYANRVDTSNAGEEIPFESIEEVGGLYSNNTGLRVETGSISLPAGQYNITFGVDVFKLAYLDGIHHSLVNVKTYGRFGIIDEDGKILVSEAYEREADDTAGSVEEVDFVIYNQTSVRFFVEYEKNLLHGIVNRGMASVSINSYETIRDSYTYTYRRLLFSNLLKYQDDAKGLTRVEYWCDEDAFGIPFQSAKRSSQVFHAVSWVPLLLKDPQYATKEEVYEKLNGEEVVLSSTINKEYEMETDYIPEEWHYKLVVALSCDHVTIDSSSCRKSGDYSIDWENYDETECGIQLAKGQCKIRRNYNERNSNY